MDRLEAGIAAVPRGALPAHGRTFPIRVAIGLVSAVLALSAIGYYRNWDVVLDRWHVDDQAMTFRFFASYIAAFAGSLAWVAITGELAAIAAIAVTVIVGSIGLSIFFAALAVDTGDGPYVVNAIAFAALLLIGLIAFRWSRALPERQAFAQPRGVRWSSGLFIALLTFAGGFAITRTAQIFPWTMTPRWLTTVGVLLLSSAAFFVYGLYRGTWAQAGGQLAGFLIYDLVLALPYARMVLDRGDDTSSGGYGMYGTPGEEIDRTALAIVVAVITVSGVISAYYLFVDPRTRLIGNRAPAQPQP